MQAVKMVLASMQDAPIQMHATLIQQQILTTALAPIPVVPTTQLAITNPQPVATTARACLAERLATTTTRAPCSIR